MKRLVFILFFIFSTISSAENLQSSDAKLIEAAGLSIYSGATFVIGNNETGFRFVTSAPVEDVRQWYRQKLPEWSLLDKYGSWILYNGNPDINIGEVMSKNQISARFNDKLPEWYGLDKNMTTEIMIMIVK
jgi:hypothetical protein